MNAEQAKNPIGYTDLIGARGVSKTDLRIQLLGAIDEASAVMSLAKSALPTDDDRQILASCQQALSALMAFTARIGTEKMLPKDPGFFAQELVKIESEIGNQRLMVEMPNRFILPGDNQATGALDLARAIIRRAEREMNAAFDQLGVEAPNARQYLNRLSSLCYLLILKYSDHTPE
ncbi:MAG: ATP:cob(I)alamin adenosyltransferase [Anaerolineaceae bacterium]|nr:ATP:cob(I)alamin adenosyltransferase [Anaerolineaceae bacterium]